MYSWSYSLPMPREEKVQSKPKISTNGHQLLDPLVSHCVYMKGFIKILVTSSLSYDNSSRNLDNIRAESANNMNEYGEPNSGRNCQHSFRLLEVWTTVIFLLHWANVPPHKRPLPALISTAGTSNASNISTAGTSNASKEPAAGTSNETKAGEILFFVTFR